jgi:4-diphosphocytidyl-2-C-methyl-D-erythritol kinase
VKSLLLHPHAKINLGLRILWKRDDGYHEIRTRFQTIDLADEMEMHLSPAGLDLRVEGASVPEDRTNLVLRAAEALREGRPGLPGARIRLVKRIPIAAGLGGGSSDAAAALLGLDRLWGLAAGPEALQRIAASLGSDVPFFLQGGTAQGEGRGEVIRPLPDLASYAVGLVLAPFGSSTSEAYRRWDLETLLRKRSGAPEDFADIGHPDGVESARSVRNDFQEMALAAHPELREIRRALVQGGAVAAALSGSGPTLFGLFPSGEAVRSLRDGRDWAPFRFLEAAAVGRREYRLRLGLDSGPDLGTP